MALKISNFGGLGISLRLFFFGFGIDGFGLLLNNSCTLVFPCFHLLWVGLHLLCLALSPILALGLAMMGLPFFLASWKKEPTLLCVDVTSSPLMLFHLVPLKLEAPSFLTFFGPKSIERAMAFLSILVVHTLCLEPFYSCTINPASVPVCVHILVRTATVQVWYPPTYSDP